MYGVTLENYTHYVYAIERENTTHCVFKLSNNLSLRYGDVLDATA